MAVVDASVIISAILSSDPHHEASKAWLAALVNSGSRFSAPAILLSEVAASLSRAYGQPDLANKIVHELIIAPFANIVPVSTSLARNTAVIAIDCHIRGCDAVYVALAETLDEELITLDRQQSERARHLIRTRKP
jgi:predicted nucleic acid-binding protein